MRRAWLIAVREIKAYAGTLSFWLSLVAGPVLMVLAALLSGPMMSAEPGERLVSIEAHDVRVAQVAEASLRESAQLDGAALKVVRPAEAQTRVTIAPRADGALVVSSEGAPISRLTWALLSRDLASDKRAPVVLSQAAPKAAVNDATVGAAGRFALVVLLWVNLIGALGMLLQAVVRERVNRALEILLTSARPLEIVIGKLIGVATLSCIVVAGWMTVGGAVAAAGAFAGVDGVGALLGKLVADPVHLGLAGAVYVMAFLMYGAALLGLSALAKDMPSAQNASRPVFGLLLLAFFAAMGMIADAAKYGWLLWAPPLTPFVLLMQESATLGPWKVAGALALMAATSAVVFAFAARSVSTRPRWRTDKVMAPA